MPNNKFEVSFKTAYTHGFEHIYALENVDPNSIRPFQSIPSSVAKSSKNTVLKSSSYESKQRTFDLGLGFRRWIYPFFLDEPIEVLELNKVAEKVLAHNDIKCLRNLLEHNLEDFVSKGVGLGHIDEIRKKLSDYLANKDPHKSYEIDFASLLRVLLAGISRKKAYLVLLTYDLQDLISLLPSESLELKRLSESKHQEWICEALDGLTSPCKILFVKKKIEEIADNLFIPWMEKRLGFAALSELMEHMEDLSLDPSISERVLIFLSEVYFSGSFPLDICLPQPVKGVYAKDNYSSDNFHQIHAKALSYFYSPSSKYSLEELRQWMQREFAKQWQGFPEGTVEKVLTLSPAFYVWKNPHGQIEIKLS